VYNYDCAQLQYIIQHRTVLTMFTLFSRQPSHLRCCVLEGTRYMYDAWMVSYNITHCIYAMSYAVHTYISLTQ